MIPTIGGVIGAGLGALIARMRKGDRMDMLHYAGVFGIIGFVVSTAVLVLS